MTKIDDKCRYLLSFMFTCIYFVFRRMSDNEDFFNVSDKFNNLDPFRGIVFFILFVDVLPKVKVPFSKSRNLRHQ